MMGLSPRAQAPRVRLVALRTSRSGDGIKSAAESLPGFRGDVGEVVSTWRDGEHRLGVGCDDLAATVGVCADHDVAGQQGTDVLVGLDRLVGQWRVARAEEVASHGWCTNGTGRGSCWGR